MSKLSRNRKLLLLGLLTGGSVTLGLIVGEVAIRWMYYSERNLRPLALMESLDGLERLRGPSGLQLNRLAWEATFLERGWDIPSEGPREGFWGSRLLPPDTACAGLDLCPAPQEVLGLLAIEEGGIQRAGERNRPRPSIMVVGGSVAFGAYASRIDQTYFHQLATLLKPEFPEVGISVLARGAATSGDDLAAMAVHAEGIDPDVVIFLNGLNDLSVNVAPISDLDRRVRIYLRNVRAAQAFGKKGDLVIVFALQPFLATKPVKSELEERIMRTTAPDPDVMLSPPYQRMGIGLKELVEGSRGSYFLDLSSVFDEEHRTTFADQWHFSDPGHHLLAQRLAEELVFILRPRFGHALKEMAEVDDR